MDNFCESFTAFLNKAQVPKGATFMLHSSFKELARQGVNAEVVLDTLCDYFQNGRVLLPTMTWKTVTADDPVFDVSMTPSHTGYLTELFRTQYATARSLHPTHSVAGKGEQLNSVLSTHQLGSSPCSQHSPYGKIFSEVDSTPCFIALLNVGLESCTFIHFFEELFAPSIYLDLEGASVEYQLIDTQKNIHTYQATKQSNIPRNFHQIGDMLLQQQKLKTFSFANSRILLFSLQDLYSVLKERFAITSYATSPSYLVEQ